MYFLSDAQQRRRSFTATDFSLTAKRLARKTVNFATNSSSRNAPMEKMILPSLVGPLLALTIGLIVYGQAADPPYNLHWQRGELVSQAPTDMPITKILKHVNQLRFVEALQDIRTLTDRTAGVRGQLALAIAGHLSNDDPQPALQMARSQLDKAIATDPNDVLARRLRNELEVYQTLASIVLPWDGNLPGHSWVPAPQLLPARDMVQAGDLAGGRSRLEPLKRAAPRTYLLTFWQFAAFFEKKPAFEEAFQLLHSDLNEALANVGQSSDEEDQRTVKLLSDLLAQAEQNSWASMTVPPESLLYPRAMLEPMRAYYWWWKQMGAAQRPMSKQGFDEIIADQTANFPNSPIVKIYTGQQVPWEPKTQLHSTLPSTPAWAQHQHELRARVEQVASWWFDVRQDPDGQLGGGWEDDVEALRRLSQSVIIRSDPAALAGIQRLADGVWSQGLIVNGFDRELKDIEHSSEMAADTSVLVAADYGNPKTVERCLETCKTIDEVHFGRNASGRRQFRSMVLSATEVSDGDNQAFDVLYSGRAMRPVAMLAWYSRHPQAVELLADWSRTWCAAAVRSAEGKPAGVFPAAIHFGDERLNGNNTWWDPGLGSLYLWNPQDLDMVWGKILLAYQLTGDEKLLQAIHAQLEILRAYQGQQIENPAPGSLDWVGMQLQSHLWLATWYRQYTGRDDYDDLIRTAAGYGNFQRTGNLALATTFHTSALSAMRFNLPMLTTEVRGTDRINLLPFSLMGPMTGSSVAITQAPSFAVTWQNITPTFSTLIGDHDSRSCVAWLYTCSKAEHPTMRFWKLQPGRYRLERRDDADQDGTVDSDVVQSFDFEHRERGAGTSLSLPQQTLCQVRIQQLEAFSTPPSRRPDLALGPDDLLLRTLPTDQHPGTATVTLHNIGAAPTSNITLKVFVRSLETGNKQEVLQQVLAPLQEPANFLSQQQTIEFQWESPFAGAAELQVHVQCAAPGGEINTQNNHQSVAISPAHLAPPDGTAEK